jgi:hypothetical protein
MKIIIRLLIAVMMLTLLSGCFGLNVYTETSAFYAPKYKNLGTITVLAAKSEVNSSLEFAPYKQQFEQKLARNGYTIVSNPLDAQYIAFVAYGIDHGKSSVVSTPIFSKINVATTYSTGSDYEPVGSFKYVGPRYTMPAYDITGSSASSTTEYTRGIALDIVNAESLRTGIAKVVYRARTISSGNCGRISGVFAEMLEAMFDSFPGERAKVRKAVIPSKGDC